MSFRGGGSRVSSSRSSSNGFNSDGSLMNVNNRLGSRPSIKLFTQYNSGSAMSALLYGGGGPETSSPAHLAPRSYAARGGSSGGRSRGAAPPQSPPRGRGSRAKKSLSPTVRRAALASATSGRNSPTPPSSPQFSRAGAKQRSGAGAADGYSASSSGVASIAAGLGAVRLDGAVTQQQQRRAPTISPAEAQLALWSAAKDGDFAGAKKAVESGADVNAVNFRDGGATALHYAARTGRVAYVFVCLVSCYLLAHALPPPPLTLSRSFLAQSRALPRRAAGHHRRRSRCARPNGC